VQGGEADSARIAYSRSDRSLMGVALAAISFTATASQARQGPPLRSRRKRSARTQCDCKHRWQDATKIGQHRFLDIGVIGHRLPAQR
jgi:hypothetical protein